MKVIALLPMKAHSERVANKNIRIFADRPLWHHVASVLESSNLIETILINTDSDLIAEDAITHFPKAKIIKRSPELQGDSVSMNRIVDHDIHTIDSEHFLQTHSTNPLLQLETLEKAIQAYFESLSEYDSLFSVTKIQNRFYWDTGKPVNHDPQNLINTQDLSPLYLENSNIYLFSKTSFIAADNNRIGLHPKTFVMNKIESTDIDDDDDWKMAEALYKMRSAPNA
jgi:CMP-N-acetylneuraminic acid synthetase